MAKAIKITDASGAEVSQTKCLAYFKQPGQNLSDFMAEIKQLTPDAKTELAVAVAREMGYSVVEA